MSNKEERKAPVLRFKGFTDDWEQRKFTELGKLYYGKSAPKWSVVEKGGTPCIRYGELYTKYSSKIDNVYSHTSIDKSKLKFSTGNELLIPRVGEEPLDFAKHTSWLSIPNVAIGEMITVLKTKENPLFLANYLRAKYVFKFARLVEGGNVSNLYFERYEDTNILIPSKNEQQNISKLILKIDKLITLQQRKLELLKASKKAVLQNIFTDTKRVPTIRFNTFSENWNQKRLKPFLIKYNKKATVNNQYPVLTSSRQGLFFQKDYYDGNQIASKNNIGYNIVPRNYFTYRHMSDDLIFHFNINTICDYGIVSTLYPVFTTTSEIDSQWLLYYLNHSVDIKKYALLQKQGGSRTYMYFSKLESLKAHIPALAEQKKISSLIFKIDEQIYFQQKKLKYLQKSKRFLLQNMFI